MRSPLDNFFFYIINKPFYSLFMLNYQIKRAEMAPTGTKRYVDIQADILGNRRAGKREYLFHGITWNLGLL